MATIQPTGEVLGATVRDVDLAKPLAEADFALILLALGRHGVLRFPDQHLDAAALRDFSLRFGSIQNMLTGFHEPRASHLAMLEAIAGHAHLETAYRAAIDGRYLWHEFGDLHLILP